MVHPSLSQNFPSFLIWKQLCMLNPISYYTGVCELMDDGSWVNQQCQLWYYTAQWSTQVAAQQDEPLNTEWVEQQRFFIDTEVCYFISSS